MRVRPKKLKDLLTVISEKTGYSTEDINDLVTCFYEDWVVKHLYSFDNSILLIEHLGKFTFRLKRCDTVIKELNNAKSHFIGKIELKENATNTYGDIVNKWKTIVTDIDSAISRMENLKNKMSEQKEKEKVRHQEKLKNYEYTKHMEKS